MKQLIPMDDYGIFANNKDTVMANSLVVAKMFGRQHKNVLQDIRNLDCSEKFSRLNFQPTSYKDEQGKKRPCINMTRDGFTFLVMGYRGKKAAQFKEAYINRFNEMEQQIQSLVAARTDYPLLMNAVKMAHEEPKHYHFSNEANLLNSIVLNMTAKEFRAKHGIEKGKSIRPYLNKEQLELMDILQKFDTGFLITTPDYQQRKRLLEWCKMQHKQKAITA